jgi:hypothetical protein
MDGETVQRGLENGHLVQRGLDRERFFVRQNRLKTRRALFQVKCGQIRLLQRLNVQTPQVSAILLDDGCARRDPCGQPHVSPVEQRRERVHALKSRNGGSLVAQFAADDTHLHKNAVVESGPLLVGSRHIRQLRRKHWWRRHM